MTPDDGEVDQIGGAVVDIRLRVSDAQAADRLQSAFRDGQMQLEVMLTSADSTALRLPVAGVSVRSNQGPTTLVAVTTQDGSAALTAPVSQPEPMPEPIADAMPQSVAVQTQARAAYSTSVPVPTPDDTPATAHTAVIWLSCRLPNAEQVMRMAVVSLDGIPGSQVEGISALYLASGLSEPDTTVAVLQLSTMLTEPELEQALSTISLGHEHGIAMTVVQFDDQTGAGDEFARSAAVLAPWCAMNPDACVAGDPIAYRLALADDADRVGLLSDNWIIGETS